MLKCVEIVVMSIISLIINSIKYGSVIIKATTSLLIDSDFSKYQEDRQHLWKLKAKGISK